jgi:hypothetical protein
MERLALREGSRIEASPELLRSLQTNGEATCREVRQ